MNIAIIGYKDKWHLVIEIAPEMLERLPESFRGFSWSTDLTWTENRRDAMEFENLAAAVAYKQLHRKRMEESKPARLFGSD